MNYTQRGIIDVEDFEPYHAPVIFVNPYVAKIISGGAAAGISSSLFNPLECLRVRWQSLPSNDPRTDRGILAYGISIVRNEGILHGLLRPGLGANVTGMVLSAAFRFGSYETVRDLLATAGGDNDAVVGDENDKSAFNMILAGISCGASAYWVTTPFHSLKTKLQTQRAFMEFNESQKANRMSEKTNLINSLRGILKENGLRGLWKGAIPLTSRGALFTTGQMIGYDGFKSFGKSYGVEDGPRLHLLSSVIAAFGASFMSAPSDLVTAKYMSAANSKNLSECIRDVYLKDGIPGYWKGWSVSFFRLTPVMLIFTSCYEQFRNQLGIGYMS
uniref:Mitochondrial carrier protein n=1 Tax=Corethron hystrix TaxID=216773 RepID=A0A7S1BPG5_9STRA|mmetsp:Transcript_34588/g.79977  ORF Transcript_34588/g.79977 Transcript_34588/m.79977 type:complete len:330 (+) Transcript_34588:78-1067(+)